MVLSDIAFVLVLERKRRRRQREVRVWGESGASEAKGIFFVRCLPSAKNIVLSKMTDSVGKLRFM